MKIAYVSFEKPGDGSGVGKKIQAQVEAWRLSGHIVSNLVISNELSGPTENTQFVGCKYVRHPYLLGAATIFRLHELLVLFKPDIIYCRQMLWWPFSVWSLSVAPLVIEANSKDLAEYKLGNKSKYLLHYLTRGLLFKAAAGAVSVTEEIERNLPDYNYKKIVIGNGYDFRGVTPRPIPHNERPQLIFVGSPGQAWHGVDKLIRLATLLPQYDFNLVVPGFIVDSVPNLKCHGGVYGKQLETLYQNMDVAIGTLALHRKNMLEATPLKTREYLAHGIPVFAGYLDSDIIGCDYFLNIGNFEDNVEVAVKQIQVFIESWVGRDIPWDEVKCKLSYDTKEKQRLLFLKHIIDNGDK